MKLKHLLVIFGIMALIAVLTTVARCAEPAVGIPAEQQVIIGYGQEFSVDLFTGGATTDFNKADYFAGFGLNYFLNANFGIGGHTSFYDTHGQFFDNFALKGIYRFPIKSTAPYVFAGAMRQLEEHEWGITLGGGLEHRFTKWLGAYAEVGIEKFVDIDPVAIGKVGIRIPLEFWK